MQHLHVWRRVISGITQRATGLVVFCTAILVASGVSFEVLAQNPTSQAAEPAKKQEIQTEALAAELAAVRSQLDQLKARQALSVATWQDRLLQEARAAEAKAAAQTEKHDALTRELGSSREEIERLRSKLSQAEAEAFRLTKALAEAASEKAAQAIRMAEAQVAEQKAKTDAIARDVVVIRQELATLKSALVRIGVGLDRTTPDLADQPLATGSVRLPEQIRTFSGSTRSDIRLQARAVTVPTARPTSMEQNLLSRADRLVRQGDIAGARLVLEHALRMSAQGSEGRRLITSMLAETYDPNRLAAWGVYGVRGDSDKAGELYAQAR